MASTGPGSSFGPRAPPTKGFVYLSPDVKDHDMTNWLKKRNLTVRRGLTENQMRELRQLFDRLDTDHDGKLDLREFQRALGMFSGHTQATRKQAKELFMASDIDGKYGICFDEFVGLVVDHQLEGSVAQQSTIGSLDVVAQTLEVRTLIDKVVDDQTKLEEQLSLSDPIAVPVLNAVFPVVREGDEAALYAEYSEDHPPSLRTKAPSTTRPPYGWAPATAAPRGGAPSTSAAATSARSGGSARGHTGRPASAAAKVSKVYSAGSARPSSAAPRASGAGQPPVHMRKQRPATAGGQSVSHAQHSLGMRAEAGVYAEGNYMVASHRQQAEARYMQAWEVPGPEERRRQSERLGQLIAAKEARIAAIAGRVEDPSRPPSEAAALLGQMCGVEVGSSTVRLSQAAPQQPPSPTPYQLPAGADPRFDSMEEVGGWTRSPTPGSAGGHPHDLPPPESREFQYIFEGHLPAPARRLASPPRGRKQFFGGNERPQARATGAQVAALMDTLSGPGSTLMQYIEPPPPPPDPLEFGRLPPEHKIQSLERARREKAAPPSPSSKYAAKARAQEQQQQQQQQKQQQQRAQQQRPPAFTITPGSADPSPLGSPSGPSPGPTPAPGPAPGPTTHARPSGSLFTKQTRTPGGGVLTEHRPTYRQLQANGTLERIGMGRPQSARPPASPAAPAHSGADQDAQPEPQEAEAAQRPQSAAPSRQVAASGAARPKSAAVRAPAYPGRHTAHRAKSASRARSAGRAKKPERKAVGPQWEGPHLVGESSFEAPRVPAPRVDLKERMIPRPKSAVVPRGALTSASMAQHSPASHRTAPHSTRPMSAAPKPDRGRSRPGSAASRSGADGSQRPPSARSTPRSVTPVGHIPARPQSAIHNKPGYVPHHMIGMETYSKINGILDSAASRESLDELQDTMQDVITGRYLKDQVQKVINEDAAEHDDYIDDDDYQ